MLDDTSRVAAMQDIKSEMKSRSPGVKEKYRESKNNVRRNKMKFKFEMKTNYKLEDITEEFIKSVTSLSKKYKVDLEIKTSINNDIKKLEILPTYIGNGTSLTNDNSTAFHRAYLDKFVSNEKLDLLVLEVA